MPRTTDRGTPVSEALSDPLDRTTTPAVDEKGTRGKAGSGTSERAKQNWMDQTKLDASCRIGQHTNAFALLLDDGKLVRFDEAGNSKVAQQIQSKHRSQQKSNILRVKVKGVLQNDMISIDSIVI